MMTTIQVRIDEKTKKSSQKVFDQLGLDLSGAIKLYLRQVVMQKRIPFLLLTENGMTVEEEQAILDASEEAARGIGVTKAMTVKEALRYIASL
jgi:DNA-damage-inducible protein J